MGGMGVAVGGMGVGVGEGVGIGEGVDIGEGVGIGVAVAVGLGVEVGVGFCPVSPGFPQDEMMAATKRATAPIRATFTLTLIG